MKKSFLLAATAMSVLAFTSSANDTARFFRPQTVSFQYYQSHNDRWGNMNVEKYTYNADGSVASMDETGQKTVYTYNQDGKVARKEIFNIYSGATTPVTTKEYEYDPIVKDFVISETEYFYQGNT